MLSTMWCGYRFVVGAAALLLALVPTGCSGDPDSGRRQASRPTPTVTPTPTSTEEAPSLRERAAPYRVRYGRVAGQIPRGKRDRFLRSLARPVRGWMEGGFVEGPWPRKGFRRAFVPFGRPITARAHREADLLTLQPLGAALVDVVPRQRRIEMSVTAVRGRVVGATARVHLRVVGFDREGRRVPVGVRGDLYLTRVSGHGWKVFGYDIDRWGPQQRHPATATTTGGGA